MYQLALTDSFCPAQPDGEILETTVGGVLRARAALTPGDVALAEADQTGTIHRGWTYAELLRDSEILATALLSRFSPGERIVVWAPNIPAWTQLEFAAALAGLVLVTANPAYRPRELRYVLEQSGAVGLFMVREYRGNPMADIAAEVAAALPRLRAVVDMEDPEALFAGAQSGRALPRVNPGDAVQIQYTSGTTGFPKGALLHHRGLTNNARLVYARAGVREGETVVHTMPMFHTSGCAAITLGTVQTGGRMIMIRQFDVATIATILEAERVGYIFAVPTLLIGLLEQQLAHPRDLSALRLAISGGAMVAPELTRRMKSVFGCAMSIVYGQTESSPVVTQTRGSDPREDQEQTAGQPLPCTEISIRDVADNATVPVGVVGEICARGYCVMLGYNDNDAATRAAIDKDGWLHTGDLGSMDARGFVRVTGRVKDMIIRGGENLFPAEIENVLLEHPDVAEVAVVGLPDERWGEIVACFLRLAPGARLDRAALVAHCRARIAPQKTPARWI